jgi:ATP-binding cassette subfamily C protein
MFDKRLMQMCPESRKYIFGNILLQFLELCCNAAMILIIARLCRICTAKPGVR